MAEVWESDLLQGVLSADEVDALSKHDLQCELLMQIGDGSSTQAELSEQAVQYVAREV